MNSNLNLAKEAAREAGSIIMKYYKKDYDIREKSYHNPVTTADKEADEKDQLYGAISKKEIINFLSEKNISILSDDIKILNSIRSLGEHTININPYVGIEVDIKISVIRN